jgi:hypothetical protein
MPPIRKHWNLILCILLGFIPIAPALFSGNTIGAFDQIRQMAPWNGEKPSVPWDVLQADSVLQFYVWRDLVFQSWGRFEVPVWNPYELGGTPLLANSQSGGLYPFHILVGILKIPTGLGIVLLAWLHLSLAALGTARAAKALGANEFGQTVSAVGFGTSAFMLAWTALPSVITTVCWIPWGVAAALNIGKDRSDWQAVIRLATPIALMLLAGHLQFAAYGLGAIGLAVIASLLAQPKGTLGKRAVMIFMGLAIGALVAGSQVRTVLEYSQFSHRRGNPTPEGYEAYVASSLKPFHLSALSSPTMLGNTRVAGPEAAPGIKVSEYWPAIAVRGANYAEGALTLGPLILAFLFLANWRAKRTWFAAALCIGAALIAFGSPLNAVLYFNVPGWSATGSPGRVIVLFVLGASLLAGLGASNTVENFTKKSWIGLGVVLVSILLVPVLNGTFSPSNVPAELISQLAAAGFISGATTALLGILLVIGCFVFLQMPDERKKTHGALGLVTVFGIAWILSFNPIMFGKPPESPAQPAKTRVAVINNDWDLLTAAPAILPPNTATMLRQPELGGYDSLLHRDTVAMLNDINGQDTPPPANGNMMFIKDSFDPKKAADAGVTEVWTRKPLETMTADPVQRDGYYVYELDGPGLADVDGKPVEIAELSPSGIRIVAPPGGKLTVRFRNIGEWTSNLGEPRKDTRWLEFDLEPNTPEITIRPGGTNITFDIGVLLLFSIISSMFGPVQRPKPE